jgi:ferredoxin
VLKSACQAGGCGACSAVLTGGRVEMGDHDPDVIETPEEDSGILLCRSFPAKTAASTCRDRGQIVTAPPTRHQARSPDWTGWPTR